MIEGLDINFIIFILLFMFWLYLIELLIEINNKKEGLLLNISQMILAFVISAYIGTNIYFNNLSVFSAFLPVVILVIGFYFSLKVFDNQ